MNIKTLPAASLLLASVALAQNGFGVRTVNLAATPPDAFLADGNIATFAVAVVGNPNQLIGGSTRTGNVNVLTANGPLGILNIGRNPLVANELGTGNYWGITMEGEWAPLSLPAAGNVTLSQDLCTIDDGSAVHVFQWWSSAWVTESLRSATYAVVPGRNFAAVVDGNTRLVGFSKLVDTVATVLDLGPSATWPVAHIAGNGESFTRRNSAMFEIGASEVAIYSGYLDAWQRFTFPAPLTNYQFEYDKNVIAISDPNRNELFMYSAHNGVIQQISVQDVNSAIVDAQDFAIKILDPLGNNLWCFRAIDGGLSILPNQASTTSSEMFGNNVYAVRSVNPITGGPEYYGCSGSKRGAVFVGAGLGASEVTIAEDVNDMVALAVTDGALYGFSAFTNRWTRLPGWQGTFSRLNAQDFIGWVETDTHAYVYSPRDDRWFTRPKAAGETLADADQFVVLGTPSSQSIVGMESTAIRSKNFIGTPFASGRGNSYSYSVHDDPLTGASRVYLFQSYGDRWMEMQTATRITDPAAIQRLEDGVLIKEADRLHILSGFADITTRFSAPNDNYAYHAFPGARPIFLANGVPNAQAVILVGTNRADLPILGALGNLQIDPIGLIGVSAGAYDARGILSLTFTLPTTLPAAVYPMQMASLAPGIGLQFGRLLRFEVY
jgi:hypothetical protein